MGLYMGIYSTPIWNILLGTGVGVVAEAVVVFSGQNWGWMQFPFGALTKLGGQKHPSMH